LFVVTHQNRSRKSSSSSKHQQQQAAARNSSSGNSQAVRSAKQQPATAPSSSQQHATTQQQHAKQPQHATAAAAASQQATNQRARQPTNTQRTNRSELSWLEHASMRQPAVIEIDDDSDGAREQAPRTPTSPPKDRGTLTGLWQVATRRRPWTPPSHKKMLGALSEKNQRAFYESLEEAKRLRAQEAAARQRVHNRQMRATGDLMPPEEARRGVKRGPGGGGRPVGIARVYEKNKKKPSGAPLLRRDPSAQEKLAIVFQWAKACAKAGVESIKDFCAATNASLEASWH